MKTQIKILILAILALTVQGYSQQAVPTAGGTVTGASGSFSFTVGQAASGYFKNSSNSMTVGVQQTYASYTTQVQAAQCATVLANLDTAILADTIVGAQKYRFEVSNGNAIRTIESVTNSFTLAQLDGGACFNTVYAIRVAVQYGGIWYDYGTSCTVTTPNIAPTAQPQTFCASVTVANLVATGSTIQWYASANEGAALPTSTVLETGIYYASQTINGCESTRTAVDITITPQVIPSFTQIDPYFLGASIQNLPTTSSNGIIGVWTPPINNQLTTTYVFSPNIGQCASNSMMTITILKHLSHSVVTNNSSICPEDQATITVIIDENKVVDIEGNIYQTVKIGSQLWMAEDLRVSTLNDGTLIPQLQSSIEWNNANDSAWCYNSANLSDCANIGKLYNFYTVSTNKMCPIGWHVPTFDEWFGESGLKTWVINSFPNQTSNSGGMLKITGTNEWNEPNEGAINLLNFNARPSGGRDLDGNFLTCGTKALYHINNTFGDGEAHYVQLSNISGDLTRISPWRGNAPETKKMGVSVRCLKN